MYQRELETLSRSEILSLQEQRLRETVERVWQRVPFYREKLESMGVYPSSIQRWEDVYRLPFTSKKDLRDQYPFGLFAVDRQEILRLHASSGTRGKPTVVGYTKGDIERWAEICARSIMTAGGRPGDVFHNAYGYGLFTGGLGMHYGAEGLGAITVPVSGGNRSRQITLIKDFAPRGIAGTPSFILSLGEAMMAEGVNPLDSSLQYGIFGAEPWSEEMRQTLEGVWGIDALDIYGLSEVIGPGVSMECREGKNGLHIAEDHFLPEVIDPHTGEPLSEGQEGELVFTSLTKEAFPLLRYRTGDIASLTREACCCGRTHARMSRIKGRIDDMLIIRGVNVFPSEMEPVVLGMEELTPHYRLIVSREGTLDTLTLEVEVNSAYFAAKECDTTGRDDDGLHLRRKLSQRLKESLGVTTNVRLMEPSALPRSEGKAVRVIDQRNLFQPG
ncbi:phenylacetate--CoA ligase family protein [Marininema halotolerans]|uniref:Phenylacetate-coenzyme A ligase n=1 Tax=Marininema halotolerans TaxID=1155944 RepID=A0A1I6UJH8_9BACL|nr:phenylacetate--CoA ligase [Marininema halotolerans]SFT01619.1 phenylacetate-CoA ligase [Marininema halotolerans]